jgi:membrane associated rhomboid family serine protease
MTFFQDPRGPRQPILLVPWPVLFLMGLLAACYAAFVLAPAALQNDVLYRFAFIPADYSSGHLLGASRASGVLALAPPFVTYVFLHGSISHLAINCIWMLPFGVVVARRFHALLFFLFFFLCGIAGAALHLALNWGSQLAVIGASGAISGLMGAGFRMIGPPFLGAQAGYAPLAPIFSPRILLWSAVWIGINILAGVTGLGTGAEVSMIAWQAHLGGYFAGLLLAGPFATLAPGLEQEPSDPR